MASQDGQPDRILRGCTQPTLAQDLPEPAAGPPAGGALEAAAGPPARRWCFGGGGCAARDRRAHALRLLRAPGGSAAGRCASELSHGRQTAPAPRPLVAGGFVLGGEAGLLYQQVTEQRQQNPDSRLKVEAAYTRRPCSAPVDSGLQNDADASMCKKNLIKSLASARPLQVLKPEQKSHKR